MFHSVDLRKRQKHRKRFVLIFLLIAFFCGAIAGVHLTRRVFPIKYSDIIEHYANKYDLPLELVYAIIRAESSFNRYAVSHAGASGLMQIMEPTGNWAAEQIGLLDFDYGRIFEPEINIHIGSWYISRLIRQFGGNLDTALAAYNAGSGNVSNWLNEQGSTDHSLEHIPFGETRNYVSRVRLYQDIYRVLLRLNSMFNGIFEVRS